MLQFQPPGFESRTIQTALGSITYYTAKPHASSSPLVFLHSMGGGSSAYEWSKVYPAFAPDHYIVAPDLIGWGNSAHPAKDYTAEDYIETIAEIINATGHPATVMSTSLSAAFAIRVAIAYPHLITSLFLVCPSGYDDFGGRYQNSLSAQLAGTPGIDRIIYTLGAANEIAVRGFMQQFLFANPSRITDEMVAAYTASAQQPNAEYSALAALKGSLFFDLSRYLNQLTVPTAFVWGKSAKFRQPDFGQRLAALNPSVVKRFDTIEQTGVLPHLECPAVVIGLLRSWLHQTGQ